MKKILAVLLGLYLFVPGANAQDDEIRQPAIGISFTMTDFATAQKIRSTSLAQVFRDHSWGDFNSMTPGLGIHYFTGLHKHIDFAATLNGTFLSYPFRSGTPSGADKFLLASDVALNFKLTSEKYWVQPYLIAGVGGYVYGGSRWGAFMPLGAGLKVNFYDETHFFTTMQYRVPVTSEANYHFLYSVGFAGAIGKKKEPKIIPPPPPPTPPAPSDRDKDGVPDENDKCPDTPGLAKYDGCPVPDSDNDGINDEEDKCPTVAGLVKYQGCPVPDTDKDGINDEEDKCPTVAGVARYQGCPVPDGDGDGINDEEDKCPTVFGVREKQGCPAISEEVKKKVDYAAQNIYFITGSAKLDKRSYKGLDEVAKIMAENSDAKLTVDGHTDNTGSDELNDKLSQNRAESVKAYLASKGVDASRLTATGYGEKQPVADNKTAAGRQKNRRVEMKLGY